MIQNNLDGREGTAVLGTKRGAQSQTADTTRTKRSSQPSLRLQPNNPKPKRVFEVVGWGVEKHKAHVAEV